MGCRIEVGGATQESAPTFIQRHGPVAGERVAFEHEGLMLFQKQLASASWREALDLSLGTLRVGAQSAEIDIPCFPEEENVGLVVGDADSTLPIEIDDGPAAGAIESSKIVETIDPYCEVDVSTLVENLDPKTPEGLEAGNLAHERPGHRAEQRDRTHLWDLCEICRYRVRSPPERCLAREHVAILFRDFLACGASGHGSGAVVSNNAVVMLHRLAPQQ